MRIGEFKNQEFHDWEGKASSVFLVLGCNMRCPYCFSSHLVREKKPPCQWEPQFKKIKSAVEAVVIRGGEPLIQKHLSIFCKKMKLSQLEVQIITNGSKPGELGELINRKVVDRVLMDVKAPFNKYQEITHSQVKPGKIKKSMQLLRESSIDYQFRTTWSPDLTKEEVLETAGQCTGDVWVLQQFIPRNCLEPSYNQKPPTDYQLMKELAEKAREPKEVRIKTREREEKIR